MLLLTVFGLSASAETRVAQPTRCLSAGELRGVNPEQSDELTPQQLREVLPAVSAALCEPKLLVSSPLYENPAEPFGSTEERMGAHNNYSRSSMTEPVTLISSRPFRALGPLEQSLHAPVVYVEWTSLDNCRELTTGLAPGETRRITPGPFCQRTTSISLTVEGGASTPIILPDVPSLDSAGGPAPILGGALGWGSQWLRGDLGGQATVVIRSIEIDAQQHVVPWWDSRLFTGLSASKEVASLRFSLSGRAGVYPSYRLVYGEVGLSVAAQAVAGRSLQPALRLSLAGGAAHSRPVLGLSLTTTAHFFPRHPRKLPALEAQW